MKKIEDYLHLYLGCEVEYRFTNSLRTATVGRGILLGIEKTKESVEAVVYRPEAGGSLRLLASEIKLILRPLSSVTEEEIEHVVWLVMDSEKHLEPDCRIGKEDIDIGSIRRLKDAWDVPVNCRCFDGKMLIDVHDGSTTLYDDNDEIQRNFNASLVITYLLSKCFDLFGLIEAGLAIDKTKTGQ